MADELNEQIEQIVEEIAEVKKFITYDNLKYYHSKLIQYLDSRNAQNDPDIKDIIGQFNLNLKFVSYYDGYSTGQQNVSYKPGTVANIAQCPFTREGFIFANWNTKNDGSGTTYTSGTPITINDDLILFAQWTPNA